MKNEAKKKHRQDKTQCNLKPKKLLAVGHITQTCFVYNIKCNLTNAMFCQIRLYFQGGNIQVSKTIPDH